MILTENKLCEILNNIPIAEGESKIPYGHAGNILEALRPYLGDATCNDGMAELRAKIMGIDLYAGGFGDPPLINRNAVLALLGDRRTINRRKDV